MPSPRPSAAHPSALRIFEGCPAEASLGTTDATRLRCPLQAYEGAAQIIMAGTDSVLRAMESYTKQAWVLRAWQDVFVDLVQGQLQHLYVSLLSSEFPPTPSQPSTITLAALCD